MKAAAKYDEFKSAWRDNYPASEHLATSVQHGFSCAINEAGFPLAMTVAFCRQESGEMAVTIETGSPERAVLVDLCKAMANGESRFDCPEGVDVWGYVCGAKGVGSGSDVVVHVREDDWIRVQVGEREATLGGHTEAFTIYMMSADLVSRVGSLLLGDHMRFQFRVETEAVKQVVEICDW